MVLFVSTPSSLRFWDVAGHTALRLNNRSVFGAFSSQFFPGLFDGKYGAELFGERTFCILVEAGVETQLEVGGSKVHRNTNKCTETGWKPVYRNWIWKWDSTPSSSSSCCCFLSSLLHLHPKIVSMQLVTPPASCSFITAQAVCFLTPFLPYIINADWCVWARLAALTPERQRQIHQSNEGV